MKRLHPRHRVVWAASIVFAFPFLTGADGNGCASGAGGPGNVGSDGGGAPGSGGGGCTQADCAGLRATLEAKLCPDGTAVGRTFCAKQPGGQCAWDFPACSSPEAGMPCQCSGPRPGAPNVVCSDGSVGGPVCATHADGTCGWELRACPMPCPALGCFPACANGVLKDQNGCDTCQCAPPSTPAVDGGPGCKSDLDCLDGVCGFPVADACSAMGTCFPKPGVTCLAYSPACACDGSEVSIVCNGLPGGYAPRPVLHAGVCTTPAVDSGVDAAADAGNCCPTTWSSYSCTFADGGTGMACHNPQMGCASSSTCGVGCDRVVSGRCGP